MPTPQQYAGQNGAIRPMDGLVPGLTWTQFMSAINGGTDLNTISPGGAHGAYVVPGLGLVGATRTENMGSGGGESGSGMGDGGFGPTYSGPWQSYAQEVGDGTQNVYTQDPSGNVLSHNQTINSDSWWDSTGLPLVASLAFGGATAGLGAAGIGVNAAGNSIAGLGQLSATDALGEFGGQAATGGTQSGSAFGALPGSAGTALDNAGTGIGFGGGYGSPSLDYVGLGQNAANGVIADPGDAITVTGSLGNGISADASGMLDFSGFVPGAIDASGFGQQASDQISSNLTKENALATGSSLLSKTPISSLGRILSGNGGMDDYASLLGGAGSLLSGVLGSNASKTAADQQTSAINNATALQAAIYGNSVSRNQPFLSAGTGALGQETSLLGLNGADAQKGAVGQFQTSPGYQFRVDQGMKAATNGASASGLIGSGRYLKDLTNYGQGQATAEYGNYENSLKNLINVGQNSANLTGQLGANYGNTAANLLTAGGVAQSAGTIGSNNAITNALSQFLKLNQNGIYGGY